LLYSKAIFQNRIGKFQTGIDASCYGNSKDPSLVGKIAFTLFI